MAPFTDFRIPIGIFLAAQILITTGSVSAGDKSNIEGRSFSLLSAVKSTTSKGSTVYLQFEEHYSIEQKRARIESKINKFTNNITQQSHSSWMVDAEQNIVLEYDRRKLECSLSSVQKIKDTFDFDLPETSETVTIDKHVVGSARVMLFVEKHSAKMVFVHKSVVRNLNCLLYKLDYNQQDGGVLHFLVYYSELSLSVNQNALPVRIEMSQEGKPLIEFDFLQVWPLSQRNNQVSTRSQMEIDPLIFEPVAGCSKVLARTNSIELFGKASSFSFEALHESTNGGTKDSSPGKRVKRAPKTKYFVAYDPEVSSMLVETAVQPDNWASTDTRQSSKKILNFALNRMYHVAIPDLADLIAYYGSYGDGHRFKQCAVSNLFVQKTQLTIGRLLVGTDKFVYMGKAVVRGLEAKAYEAHDVTELPYWLTQPIVYVDKRTQRSKMQNIDTTEIYSDPNDSTPEPNNVVRSVMLYFGQKNSNHPLLLIEIYAVDSISHEIVSKKSIQVHNFAWSLVESADGDRVSDLFSLRDSCTDHMGASARIELLLESDEIYDQGELKAANILLPDSRNLALLAGLQKRMDLPSQMVYDLKTTMVNNTSSTQQAGNFLKMAATFNVAIHTKTLVTLAYIGQGLQDDSKMLRYSRSFQDCFHLAAHHLEPIYFGYNNQTRTCYLDPEPIDGTGGTSDASRISVKGPVGVYRTVSLDDKLQLDFSHWAREVDETAIGYNGAHILLKNMMSQSKDSAFTIKSVKKDYENPFALRRKTNEAALNSTAASFAGFGLPRAEGNRLVLASSLSDLTGIAIGQASQQATDSDSSESSMTFDQCHSACLSDFECQSFSVCIRNAQVECMISKVSFKSANVIDQLETATKIAAVGKRQKGKLTIKLDDGSSAELTRYPTCELRNKNFLELFRKSRDSAENLRYRLLTAVDGRADCAEKCLVHNLELMKQGAIRNSALIESSDPENKAVHSERVQSIIKEHRETMKKWCSNFYYLDKRQIRMRKEADQIESKIRDLVLTNRELENLETAGGFCVVPAPANYSDHYQQHCSHDFFSLYFDIEVYEFRMEFFYEKQYGVGIKESALSAEQYSSYREVKWRGHAASEQHLMATRKLVDRGYNFNALLILSPHECAYMCFIQISDLWPACRSFDIFLFAGSSPRCQLNTITLAQARARGNDQLITMPNDTKIWHYEPRSGFVLNESMLSGDIELAEESLLSQLNLNSALGVRLHLFGCFLIVILGLASGIAVGLWSGKRILSETNNTLTSSRVDIESLVEQTREVQFANQVNSNGQITVNC